MKQIFSVFYITIIVGFCTSAINAQITLTYSDLQAATADGVSLTNNEDTLTTSLNIGSTGASSWNFTGLTSHVKTSVNYINPVPTPFYPTYPTANVGEKMTINYGGTSVDMYMYMAVNTEGFHLLGMSYSLIISPAMTQGFRNTKSSPDYSIKVPLALGTTWDESNFDTTQGLFNGIPVNTEYDNYSKTFTVDAYGSATWPDGKTYQVLRLKTDSKRTTKFSPAGPLSYSRKISYSFISKEGLSVEVTANDTTSPSSGSIQLGGRVNWTTNGATGVNETNYTANDFKINQNYPNPFNPSTVISYQIPNESKVNIKVFDLMGKEVAALVNEVKPAGAYSVTFNASNLPSGVYIYKLTAGHFMQSNKMILIK